MRRSPEDTIKMAVRALQDAATALGHARAIDQENLARKSAAVFEQDAAIAAKIREDADGMCRLSREVLTSAENRCVRASAIVDGMITLLCAMLEPKDWT